MEQEGTARGQETAKRPAGQAPVNLERKEAAAAGEDSRIAMISIILDSTDGVSRMNEILHAYGPYIIGRMGIPYREKGLCLIAVAIDAPLSVTSALTGQIGRIPGISVKTAYAKR